MGLRHSEFRTAAAAVRSTSSVAVAFGKDRRVSLETLSAIAQLIAALGVIASLFYLAVQIRQNTRSMRAVVVDSLAQPIADVIRPMAEDRALMRAVHLVAENWHNATDGDPLAAVP